MALGFGCFAVLAMVVVAEGRLVRPWTDAELMDKSDLVVIATPIGTRDLEETSSLGRIGGPFRGVETLFKVLDARKGKPPNDRIILHHYRIENWSPPNGPMLINFTPNRTNPLILYLIGDGTNRYAPTAGQIDPGLSIKPIFEIRRGVYHQADAIVEEMRGLNMQSASAPLDDGRIDPKELRWEEIIKQLRLTRTEAVSALIHTLKDPNVQMRRNTDQVIIWLAGGYDGGPKMDMQRAIPALSQATKDVDGTVRAWAALALGENGSDAKASVPALIKLVHDSDEGCRNDACIALGDIGPAAKEALPALRIALNDPSRDVRQFAKLAIDKIRMRKS